MFRLWQYEESASQSELDAQWKGIIGLARIHLK
jgi:hypothetical protein